MKVVDCYWERRNLGCSAVEASVALSDTFNEIDFKPLEEYDYAVVKVPVGKLDFNYGLTKIGYSMIELQMTMLANMKSFNFEERNIKRILPSVSYQYVVTKGDLEELLNKITPGMFSTDRISLDPYFGKEVGCVRYKNWIKDIFADQSAIIVNIFYKENNVGFVVFKDEDDLRGLVGGLFSEFQDDGIGLLTPCSLPFYAKMKGLDFIKIYNPISSNNKAVWDLYEHFGYIPKQPHYVFVKHNDLK